MNILKSVTSSFVNQSYQTLSEMSSQDLRIGKIVCGIGLTASGAGLIIASGIPKTLKSWYWTNDQEKIDNHHKNSHPTAWQWGAATTGLVLTGYGIYTIASGILELTDMNDIDESDNFKPHPNIHDCHIQLLETKDQFLSCPEAEKLWNDVKNEGGFSIRCATTEQTPTESMISFQNRIIVISEKSKNMVKPLLHELNNLKRTEAFSSIKESQCMLNPDNYAISTEKIIYETAQANRRISEFCVNNGYWPKNLKNEELSGILKSFNEFLENQEKYAPTDWLRMEWYKECRPQDLLKWLTSNKDKWRNMLPHTQTPEKIQVLLNMIPHEEL